VRWSTSHSLGGVRGSLAREDAVAREHEVETEDGDEREKESERRRGDGVQQERGRGDDGHRVDERAAGQSVSPPALLRQERRATRAEGEEAGEDVPAENRAFERRCDGHASSGPSLAARR
jgi:hypothetical protein